MADQDDIDAILNEGSDDATSNAGEAGQSESALDLKLLFWYCVRVHKNRRSRFLHRYVGCIAEETLCQLMIRRSVARSGHR